MKQNISYILKGYLLLLLPINTAQTVHFYLDLKMCKKIILHKEI